jgi:hypothetical protein
MLFRENNDGSQQTRKVKRKEKVFQSQTKWRVFIAK